MHSWKSDAVNWYQRYYNFDEKTDEEIDALRHWWNELRETMPPQYLTGVHLLAEEAAFMGEDIYVVDGRLQHPTHVACTQCQHYGIVFRTMTERYSCLFCNP